MSVDRAEAENGSSVWEGNPLFGFNRRTVCGADGTGRMKVLYFTRDYTPHDVRFLSAIAALGHEGYFLRLCDEKRGLDGRRLPGGIRAVDWRWGTSIVSPADYPRVAADLKAVAAKVRGITFPRISACKITSLILGVKQWKVLATRNTEHRCWSRWIFIAVDRQSVV